MTLVLFLTSGVHRSGNRIYGVALLAACTVSVVRFCEILLDLPYRLVNRVLYRFDDKVLNRYAIV